MVIGGSLGVSKRARLPLIGLACLLAAQMVLGAASCQPEPTPMAARVVTSF